MAIPKRLKRSDRGRKPEGDSGSSGKGSRDRDKARRERAAGRSENAPSARHEEAPKRTGSRPGGAVGAVAALAFGILRGVWAVLNQLLSRISGPLGRISSGLGRVLHAASAWLTPSRGLLIAAIGCAVLLGLSQFADYRGVVIGIDDYAGVESVAPAPEVDRAELGSAHSYLMIPVAVVVIALLALASRRGRWQLCRLAALVGVAVIAVSIFIDRPAGLDEGDLANSFSGVEAQILGGWWVQLFAAIGLTLTSLMLAGELRRAGAPTRRRSSRRSRGGAGRAGSKLRPGSGAGAGAGAREAGA